ncbi:hypothetical protein Tco_1023908 [Tanacetum coccineum]
MLYGEDNKGCKGGFDDVSRDNRVKLRARESSQSGKSWTYNTKHGQNTGNGRGPEFWDNSTVPYGKTWTMVNGPDQRDFNLPEKIFNRELKRRT